MADIEMLEAMRQIMREELQPINGRLDAMDGRLNVIDGRLDQMQGDITKMKGDITHMQEDIDELKENTKISRGVEDVILVWAEDPSLHAHPLFRK